MSANYPWAAGLNIEPHSLIQWQQEAGSTDLFEWCIQNRRVTDTDYIRWATEFYMLPSLSPEFFTSEFDPIFFNKVKLLADWNQFLFPVGTWDGVLFVACAAPPEHIDVFCPYRLVLAPPAAMSIIWRELNSQHLPSTGTLTELKSERLDSIPAVPEPKVGDSISETTKTETWVKPKKRPPRLSGASAVPERMVAALAEFSQDNAERPGSGEDLNRQADEEHILDAPTSADHFQSASSSQAPPNLPPTPSSDLIDMDLDDLELNIEHTSPVNLRDPHGPAVKSAPPNPFSKHFETAELDLSPQEDSFHISAPAAERQENIIDPLDEVSLNLNSVDVSSILDGIDFGKIDLDTKQEKPTGSPPLEKPAKRKDSPSPSFPPPPNSIDLEIHADNETPIEFEDPTTYSQARTTGRGTAKTTQLDLDSLGEDLLTDDDPESPQIESLDKTVIVAQTEEELDLDAAAKAMVQDVIGQKAQMKGGQPIENNPYDQLLGDLFLAMLVENRLDESEIEKVDMSKVEYSESSISNSLSITSLEDLKLIQNENNHVIFKGPGFNFSIDNNALLREPKVRELDNAQSQDEVGKMALEIMAKYYKQNMILLFQGGQLKPWKWDQNWSPKKPLSEAEIDLTQNSIFRIAHRTNHPYHGYIVPNDTNNRFFSGWNHYQLPHHISIVPLCHGPNQLGMLVGTLDQSTKANQSLDVLLELAERMTQHLVRVSNVQPAA